MTYRERRARRAQRLRPYMTTNLSGTIGRSRKRLAQMGAA